MGERDAYNDRINAAAKCPNSVSIISDGMQQAHCTVPYTGNRTNIDFSLKQHIQGVLVHNKCFHVFR